MSDYSGINIINGLELKERHRRLVQVYALIISWPIQKQEASHDANGIADREGLLEKNAKSSGDAVDLADSKATPRSGNGEVTHGQV